MSTAERPTDFDFLLGTFAVSHSRLRERLVGCDEWDEFPGTCTSQLVLGGLGLVEDNLIDLPGGAYHAVGLRTWDPVARCWSIWWFDGRTPHVVDPPVVGRFGADGIGTFTAEDHHEGRPIVVRFQWSEITRSSARWEQAFSADDGRTWEVNWVMTFARSTG